MKILARTLIAAAFVAHAASLLAVNVVGVWKGKVTIDSASAPKPQNDQQKQAMEGGMAMVKKMVVTLTLKTNKTYTAEAKNAPGKPGPEKSEGTWKQEGNALWLTPAKDNGKPAPDKKPQKFLILDGGRKLSLAAEGMPPWVKVTFTR